ncbi:MAG: hypothetical protein ACP5HM_14280 [Anaerolineae bacterium]
MLRPIPEREWGRATELAEQYGISRTLLYELRDRAEEALYTAFLPQPPGPAPEAETVLINRDFIRRSVTVLSLLKGSVRDIQLGFDLLQRSLMKGAASRSRRRACRRRIEARRSSASRNRSQAPTLT